MNKPPLVCHFQIHKTTFIQNVIQSLVSNYANWRIQSSNCHASDSIVYQAHACSLLYFMIIHERVNIILCCFELTMHGNDQTLKLRCRIFIFMPIVKTSYCITLQHCYVLLVWKCMTVHVVWYTCIYIYESYTARLTHFQDHNIIYNMCMHASPTVIHTGFILSLPK